MRDALYVALVLLAIFYVGYFMGGQSEERAQRDATDEMRLILTAANDKLILMNRTLEAKNNETERTIRNTPDPTGCGSTTAPRAILDSVR